KGLVNQPVIRAEEFKLHRCWLGSWFEAVDVAANRLEEVGAAADIDVGAAEVVGGDIKKFAVATHCRNELAIIQLTSKRADVAFLCPGLGGVIGVQVEHLAAGLVLRQVR